MSTSSDPFDEFFGPKKPSPFPPKTEAPVVQSPTPQVQAPQTVIAQTPPAQASSDDPFGISVSKPPQSQPAPQPIQAKTSSDNPFGLTDGEKAEQMFGGNASANAPKAPGTLSVPIDTRTVESTSLQPILTQTGLSTEGFDMSEVTSQAQTCIVIYGRKGEAKTTSAMSLPGTIACLSFDKKGFPVKSLMYGNDPRIHVYDAVRYLNEEDTMQMLESNVKTIKYVNYLLDEIAKNPVDWVIIDGSEILTGAAEMLMRAEANIAPYAGFKEFALWKRRKVILTLIHRKAMSAARKGLIYTSYVDKDEVIDDNGIVTMRKDVPKWLGVQVHESDVVIRVTSKSDDKSGRRFFAEVESSKVPLFKTGDKKDITNVGFAKAFGIT